jgi:hypothetical protein
MAEMFAGFTATGALAKALVMLVSKIDCKPTSTTKTLFASSFRMFFAHAVVFGRKHVAKNLESPLSSLSRAHPKTMEIVQSVGIKGTKAVGLPVSRPIDPRKRTSSL